VRLQERLVDVLKSGLTLLSANGFDQRGNRQVACGPQCAVAGSCDQV
jgi:hypothetical protein